MEDERDEVTEVTQEEAVVADAKALFATLGIDEINAVLKEVRTAATEAKKAIRKAEKDAEKAEAKKKLAEVEAKNIETIKSLKEGDSVNVTIGSGKHQETVEAAFVKMTEKRFTVMIDGVKRSVMFHKFEGVVEEEVLSEDEQAEVDQEFPADVPEVESDAFVEEDESVEVAV